MSQVLKRFSFPFILYKIKEIWFLLQMENFWFGERIQALKRKMYNFFIVSYHYIKFGRSSSNSIVIVHSSMVLFFLSATPFFLRLQGTMSSLLIPASLQYEIIYFEVYSHPLSNLKVFIFLSVKVSTSDLNSLKFSNSSSFVLRRQSHVFLELSSMKVTW